MTYVPNGDVSLWQMAAVALCEHACGYAEGRNKTDPVYIEVTEHRDGPRPIDRKSYSSCGDLAWWLLFRLGLRKPWMNRAANGTYNIGMNVADLTGSPVTRHAMAGYSPDPGDIVEVWNLPSTSDAHVTVILGPGPTADQIRTANYGAGGMSEGISPGAVIRNSRWTPPASPIIGTRRVQRFIKLRDVVPLLTEPPDLTGAKLTGEVIDALQALKWTNS